MSERSKESEELRRVAHISAAMLFLEMILIRWVAAEIRLFAYMHNLLLITAFFGIGLGCFLAERRPQWTKGLAALAGVTLIVTDPLRLGVGEIVTQGLAVTQDMVVWFVSPQSQEISQPFPIILSALVIAGGLMVLVAGSLIPFGQELGALLNRHPKPLAAYAANLIGSLAGTWLFFGLSAAATDPMLWFGVNALLILPFLVRDEPRKSLKRAARVVLAALTVIVICMNAVRVQRQGRMVIWSPYQKLDVSPLLLPPVPGSPSVQAGYVLHVNTVGYQAMLNLSDTFRALRPDIYNANIPVHYDVPYRLLPSVGRMLVVGAGTGNDVAAGLRHGAQQIDAVEIDPAILELGVSLHPERPYSSQRVRPIVEDARSFFKQAAPNQYDLVWFGLLDSHTTASGYTTLRLDHYVYTKESFAEAKRLLRPHGYLVCIFETHREWISDRIYHLLRETFDGVAPVNFRLPGDVYSGWGGEIFIAGDEQALAAIRQRLEQDSVVRQQKQRRDIQRRHVRPTTDDWPYLYLPSARIPGAYGLIWLAFALAWWPLRRAFLGRQPIAWPFFFLGAGFLLFEVLGVSRAALVFGATWAVTAIVISGVLGMALLANGWAASHRSKNVTAPFVGILLCGGLLAFFQLDLLSAMAWGPRVVATAVLFGAPMYFSGIVFSRLFEQASDKRIALGSNLFGAIVGGLCEQATLIFGIRSLTFFGLLIYCAALISFRNARKGG